MKSSNLNRNLNSTLELGEPFFLYVGSLEPRKNLGCLLEAWDHAALKDWRLVIVGERAGIFENVSLKTNSPQVIFTGRLDNQKLVNLYRGAHAFVSPSVYEGFGLPPLEAMACGCPCVISDIPAHREVCGIAPTYVPAHSVKIGWTRCAKPRAGVRQNANVESNWVVVLPVSFPGRRPRKELWQF